MCVFLVNFFWKHTVSQFFSVPGVQVIDDPKRDKNPTLNREVLCAECVPVRAMDLGLRTYENQLPVLVCVAAGERRKGDRERRRRCVFITAVFSIQ
jgi:hypothetical protein